MTMASVFALHLMLMASLGFVDVGGQLLTLSRPRRQLPDSSDCFNVCELFPVCKNGGTCIHGCPYPTCQCAPGFWDKDCGKRITTTADSVNVTMTTTVSTVEPSQSSVDVNVTASTSSTSDVTPTTRRTPRPPSSIGLTCPELLCRHGTCNQTELARGNILCECDEGWVGVVCDERCSLPCEHGKCYSDLSGRERCECQHPYVNDNNVCVIPPEDPEKKKWVAVVAACSVLLVLLLLLLVALPYWLWKKREIFIMKVVYFFQPYEDEDGKLFDAFISYVSSPRDESFVYRRLYPQLEKEMGFKLCLHHRDFQVGETIANNIIWAVQNSRRTLLILSPDYLKSEFTRFEYQEAQREMLRLKHRIVPVMLDDVEPLRQSMDPTLKTILSSITYIKWPLQSQSENGQVFQLQELMGDAEEGFEKQLRKFWKRLELSLPKKKRQPGEVNSPGAAKDQGTSPSREVIPAELEMSSPTTDGRPPSYPGSSPCPRQSKDQAEDPCPSGKDKEMEPPAYESISVFLEDVSTPMSLEAMAKGNAGPIESTYI